MRVKVILLALIASSLASFCINGLYEYSYDRVDGEDSFSQSYQARSYSTAMVLDLNTEKLFSKRVDELNIGDYVLSHNGYFTYVRDIIRTNITNPQLYYRYRSSTGYGGYNSLYEYLDLSIDLAYESTNVVFTDSEINIINDTTSFAYHYDRLAGQPRPDVGIGSFSTQFGQYNFTDNIHYDISLVNNHIRYYTRGVDIVNMAKIVDFVNDNNISSITVDGFVYENITATIHPCEAITIITDSGSATVNGLFFF
jgi:hypothetical protein